ncbi:MAG: hypothetical protein K0R34_1138 [Herbinix sp.]|jgi:hypothetical protein|nr:hypothetical protein [Herbinix sp.]
MKPNAYIRLLSLVMSFIIIFSFAGCSGNTLSDISFDIKQIYNV